ncbi:MAG: hypothetical protein FWD61_08280 [Phycisphaerales bacterium]|nr:hypothetical protein [Phycisphaerales bacterium]
MSASEHFNRYHLRRTLFPWKFRETIEEVLAFAKTATVEEVIWKMDTEDISHGLPTLERVRGLLPALNESRERFAEVGIAMSINPWVSQGMRDAGWDLRAVFPDFEWITDITGIQAKSQACPLGPAFREWLAEEYELYASTRPRVLWIEDDFRVHRHRPVTVACYCQRHVQEFSRKIGRPFTRETLAAEVLRPGEPSPVRAQWFDFIGDVMCDVVELLAKRVYGKYPDVRLGLMCNSPEVSASEHRHWDRMMEALAGHHSRVTVRPGMGMYTSHNLHDIYAARYNVAGTLNNVRRPAHACTEVENYSYSRFCKSLRVTRTQILLSAALRCPSMTLNLYDHCGTPLRAEPQYGKLLAETRPMLDQIVAAFPIDGIERGVRMLSPENGSAYVHLQTGQKFHNLILRPEPWAETLQNFGNSITWSTSPVVAVCGQRIRPYRNNLEQLFSNSTFLDLGAIEVLREMVGAERLRQLTGITLNSVFQRRDRIASMEAMSDPEFGGPFGAEDPANAGGKIPAKHVTIDTAGLLTRIGDFTPGAAVRVVSWMMNADLERMLPAFMLFENSLGGRVAICPYDLHFFPEEHGPWFVNWHRQQQISRIVNWLFRGKTPLQVEGGAYALPIRTDYPDHTSLAIFNLSLDPWEKAVLRLAMDCEPRGVSRLKTDGQWEAVTTVRWDAATGCLTIESALPIEYGDAAVFRIA